MEPSQRSSSVAPVLLLDFDQTLIDSQRSIDWCAALRELEARFGPLAVPKADGCALQTVGVLAAQSDATRWRAMSQVVEGYELAGAAGSTLMPHAPALLAATRRLPKAIVTSGSAAAARAAGIRFVGITNGRPGAGFDPTTTVVDDLRGLLEVLAG